MPRLGYRPRRQCISRSSETDGLTAKLRADMKKILLFVVLPAALLFAAFQLWGGSQAEDSGPASVQVQRGSIAVEAMAVGRVEAVVEVPVKSVNGGVLTKRFVQLGQKVREGDPIGEVRPVLTDRQRLQAERALIGAQESEAGAEEMNRGENLAGWAMRFMQGGKSLQRMEKGAERARENAQGNLELLLNGSAEIDGKIIDYVVRAPIDGHVIELEQEEGQPIVPSSSYGSGTELCVLADLDRPVFRGTVDEIDVGRLVEGMDARITIGAKPDQVLSGKLTEIALKAQTINNAVQFEVEMDVEVPSEMVIRSGYSAVARIQIQRVDDVLVLPERVVDFRDGQAYILKRDEQGNAKEVKIQTGLSDGLSIEVKSGLSQGDSVLERY